MPFSIESYAVCDVWRTRSVCNVTGISDVVAGDKSDDQKTLKGMEHEYIIQGLPQLIGSLEARKVL
jgi:hypothetical protein